MSHLNKANKLDSQIFEIIASEAIMGIIAFHSQSGECYYVNRLARETLEMGFEDSKPSDALRIHDLIPELNEQSPTARPLSKEMLGNEGLFQDVLVRKKNGLIFIANVGVKKLTLDDGTSYLLLMFQDTTIQKRLQREVQAKQEQIHRSFAEILEQNRQLKELDQAKDRFIALTTHELRTPLSAILATADVLVNHLYESEEQKEEFVATVHEQATHLMTLVNDILDFAKIRAGKLDLYVEHLELAPMLESLVRNFDQMASQQNIKVEVELSNEAPHAYADLVRLREVIDNVVNNAIKYNRPNGSVKIGLQQGPEFVRVWVSDTGIGIPADRLHQVFDEFETIGRINHHHKGTGLGMPIAKRLMEMMGGSISLESTEGVGSTFFIDIPVNKVLDESNYRSRQGENFDLAA